MQFPLFETTNNLVYIFLRYILHFLFVVNGKQVNTRLCRLYDHIESDDSQSATFTPTFAFYSKTDFAFAASQRNSCFWVLHQFILQIINIIGKRTVTLSQTLCLAQKFFSIVEGYHRLLCLCSKFLYQCIKRIKILTCKSPFLGFFVAFCNSVCYKSFLCFSIRRECNHFVNSYTFYCSKNFFQTWEKACILNTQYNLRHIISAYNSAAKIRISEQRTKGKQLFLCSFERKYLLKTRKARISAASVERDVVNFTTNKRNKQIKR